MNDAEESQPKRPRIDDNEEGDSTHSQEAAEVDQVNEVGGQKEVINSKTDHLSALHLDLLLDVLSRLDYKDFGAIDCLSKRWHALVNNANLRDKQKETCGDLLIHQDQSLTHFFALNFKSADSDNYNGCFRYFIHGDPLMRAKFPGGNRHIDNTAQAYYLNSKVRPPKSGKHTTVPITMWENLEELLLRRTWQETSFYYLLIDNSFCEHVTRVLKANSNFFYIYEPIFDIKLDVKEFQQLLLSANVTSVVVTKKKQKHPKDLGKILEIFSEPFLMRFSEARNAEIRIVTTLSAAAKITSRWIPSKEFLPILYRFDTLHLASVKLTSEQFVELVKEIWGVQNHKSYAFSLTEEIKSQHLLDLQKSNLKCFINTAIRDQLGNQVEKEARTADWWTVKGREAGEMGDKFGVHFCQVEIVQNHWMVFIDSRSQRS